MRPQPCSTHRSTRIDTGRMAEAVNPAPARKPWSVSVDHPTEEGPRESVKEQIECRPQADGRPARAELRRKWRQEDAEREVHSRGHQERDERDEQDAGTAATDARGTIINGRSSRRGRPRGGGE